MRAVALRQARIEVHRRAVALWRLLRAPFVALTTLRRQPFATMVNDAAVPRVMLASSGVIHA